MHQEAQRRRTAVLCGYAHPAAPQRALRAALQMSAQRLFLLSSASVQQLCAPELAALQPGLWQRPSVTDELGAHACWARAAHARLAGPRAHMYACWASGSHAHLQAHILLTLQHILLTLQQGQHPCF